MTPHEIAESYQEHPMVQKGLAEIDENGSGRPVVRLLPSDPDLGPTEIPIRGR